MPAVQRSSFSLERLIEVCDRFYERDGFVKWSDVGKALGVSRQAVQLRLRAAVDKGQITEAMVERWKSMTSRAAAAREREAVRSKEKNAGRLSIKLTPDNHAWLLEQCAFRRITSADLINGLLTRERELNN